MYWTMLTGDDRSLNVSWRPEVGGHATQVLQGQLLALSLRSTTTWSSDCFLASPGFKARANVNTIKWDSDGGLGGREGVKSNKKKWYHWGEQSAVITFISTDLLLEHWGGNERWAFCFAAGPQAVKSPQAFFIFYYSWHVRKTARFTVVLWEFLDDLSWIHLWGKAFFMLVNFNSILEYLL